MSIIISALASLMMIVLSFSLKDTVNDPSKKSVQKLTLAIGLFLAVITILQGIKRTIVVIGAGEIGVKEFFGKVDSQPLMSGLYITNPLVKVTHYSTRLQDVKEALDSTSQEGLSFQMDVSLQYRVDPTKVTSLYQNIGVNYGDIVVSRFRSLVRSSTSKYPLQDIYSEKRELITQDLTQQLRNQLIPLGFIVEDVLLRNIILPEQVQKAIQDKLTVKEQNEQQKIEIEKAKKVAERQKIEAIGLAESQKILSSSLTPPILQLKSIEAMQKLSESQNAKIIILGSDGGKTPIILQDK